MKKMFVNFYDKPGSSMQKEAETIFTANGGEFYTEGTALAGKSKGERTVGYDVPDDKAADCMNDLEEAGFSVGYFD